MCTTAWDIRYKFTHSSHGRGKHKEGLSDKLVNTAAPPVQEQPAATAAVLMSRPRQARPAEARKKRVVADVHKRHPRPINAPTADLIICSKVQQQSRFLSEYRRSAGLTPGSTVIISLPAVRGVGFVETSAPTGCDREVAYTEETV
ncbi:hypothetical protein PoB_005195500 [Plakobranchus ocellatus]|uniref:Uncharacterized protein n=1 Tax=Plakobranchus ocellatus TaxID=259542 RepID=A0AAV4BYF4_9GAST|nr:hypothetical protein PoB_005195500 [Plakobranchus ocellatus]